jgi:hypothetical protein
MRGRLILGTLGVLAGSVSLLAQPPALPQSPAFPQAPASPPGPIAPPLTPPRTLPPGLGASPPATNVPGSPGAPGSPRGAGAPKPEPIAKALEIPLPQKEDKLEFKATDVSVKRIGGSWQVWHGQKVLRDLGNNESGARDIANVYRELRPTEWITIGGPKPIVEYGLVNGRAPMAANMPGQSSPDERKDVFHAGGIYNGPPVTGASAKEVLPIDLKTVRVEAVRGVWCVRDDNSLLFNFGSNKADAEQAAAVIQRYGFNRVGVVGTPAPVMNYLFASTDTRGIAQNGPYGKLVLQSQIDGMTRVGIPVGGVGFVGELIKFDPRKLEVRKDGGDWVLASGSEIFGRFGPTEYAARDALRTIQESRFNEFCKVGSAGLTFFLSDGQAPARVPYRAQARRFDPNTLKVTKTGDKWAVTEGNRHLLDCASAEEGETLIRVLKHYQFDQLARLGPGEKYGVTLLARGK